MAVPKVICPICGESTTHRPGSGPVVACPRCGSSFGEHEAVLVDSEWTARIYSELSTLTAPLPPVRSDARGLPDVPGYEVLAFVARGGMGIVLKARQVALRRLVALKMPLPHEGMSEEARERFLREARSAADLRHPNICPVYEVGDHEGRPYIAMAFIEGETLRDWAKRQRPSPHRAAQMVAVVARAVQHAHEHGVIHRDIKPGNIMVEGETEQPVLTDFGLAKVVSEDAPGLTVTLSGQVIGTPAYMAPEQAAGRTHEIGPRTDVYALGAVLYDLLCDRPPFLGTAMEILTHVQTAEPVPPRKQKPGIQRDLETICLKALAREAAGRYESALALAEDLDRFCAGESILARPEGLASKLARKARGNPIGAVGLTVALLAVIALVGFALAARRTRRIAAFTHAFDSQLEAGDWSAAHVEELDALARDLARLSPERGAAAHERLTQRLAASIRERIRQPVVLPDDAARIRSAIGVLAARSSDLAPPLGQALEERLRLWQTLFDLSPPFHDVETVFGRGQVQIDGGAMLSRASDARADPVVLTAVRCEGNIQLEASFSGSWQAAYKVGLLLNASAGNRGYTVLLRVPRPEPPAAPAAAAPRSASPSPLRGRVAARSASSSCVTVCSCARKSSRRRSSRPALFGSS